MLSCGKVGINVSETHQQKEKNLPGDWQRRASGRIKEYKNMLERADKRKLLKQLPELHEEAYATTDCLTCAACCKNYSPRFKTPDIKRISKVLGMKEGAFIEKYLRIDEDGDYVLQSTPCSFLGADNRCSIYEDRPSDCARFPYTDEDVIVRRIPLTLKNVTFCPIVYKVLEGVMKVQ